MDSIKKNEPILGGRYDDDGKASLIPDELQKKAIKQLNENIRNRNYKFETIDCIICGSANFQLLSKKDKFGLLHNVVICKECGLVQTNPRMVEDSYKKFYDTEYRSSGMAKSLTKDKFFLKQKKRGWRIHNYLEKILGEKIENKFIMEIGTGAGGILQYFKEKNNQVLGLDLGSEYIEYGKKQGLNLKVGTIEILKTLEEKPDIVIYSHVLEHTTNPIEDLKNLREHLKPKSIVYIEVPGIKFLTLSYKQDFLQYLNFSHTYHFTLASLNNCLKKSGFRMINGNEVVIALFQPSDQDDSFENTYESTMNFLQKLEKDYLIKFSCRKIRFKMIQLVTKILNITNTREPIELLYYKIKTQKY
jgi:2-polyprenyl-3-methyl-5-hydroxy-6-metoxy-1,4-benzoquinol methylase